MAAPMKKTGIIFLLTVLIFLSCSNFFHDLVPNSGDRIISFHINGQLHSEIHDNEVIITVGQGASFNSIIPVIQVSPGATVLPITWDYISRSFGDERTFGAAMQIYAGGNMTDNVINMIQNNRSFTRPEIDLPIDFRYPVDFLVISGLGTVRQYTVKVVVDTGEGRFNSFSFDKFYNPDLVRTTNGLIDTTAKTVTINVSYPVENIASYELIPVFTTNNARVYLAGTEITSGETVISFEKPQDHINLVAPNRITQEKTLILKRTGYDDVTWTLTVNFSEDPDTSRAITDFRFIRSRNPLIAADYMATITNSGNTGIISVTVYYSGARPEELRADFVSPGTVRVNGATQISGNNYIDYSSPVLFTVTSRLGDLTRTYTVTVNLVEAFDPLPQITSFSLSSSLNTQLASSSIGLIDHNARLIIIEAAYDGATPPFNLRPHFTATNNVTVNGVNQLSGLTQNNFSGPVGYTVINPSNPTLRREYRVEVIFVKALSSVAEITSFMFYKADNPDLIADTAATINQGTGAITATLLFDTPGGDRTLVPRFSAQGNVDIAGLLQTSGDARQFYTPVNYRAVSIDGLLQKNYTITIKEVNNRIYVRQSATGRNDGTHWENAYTNMPRACNDTTLFPDEIFKEIWIAQGIYTPSDHGNINDLLPITPNTSYIGGFAGGEASVSARINPQDKKAVITGNLGFGLRSWRLFSTASGSYNIYSPTHCSFEFLILKNAGLQYYNGAGIYFFNSEASVYINNVNFDDLTISEGNGGALYIWCKELVITDSTITNSMARRGGGAYLHIMENAQIINSRFENCIANYEAGAIYKYSSPLLTIIKTDFINCMARENYKIMYGLGDTIFQECNFISDNKIYTGFLTDSSNYEFFGSGGRITMVFKGCTFNNLWAYSLNQYYIFNQWGTYPDAAGNGGAVFGSTRDITLQDCTFIFYDGNPGLCALYGRTGVMGTPIINFLMDGATIYDMATGIERMYQPLMWFFGNEAPNLFKFKKNNIYNNQPIIDQSSLLNLQNFYVLRLQLGAMPVLID